MKWKTEEEINAIVLDDVIVEILSRLLDLSDIPIGDHFYNLLPDSGQSLYDRVQIHVSLIKPSLLECEDELNVFKTELLNSFGGDIAEQNRIDAINARFDALSDLRMLVDRADVPSRENLKKVKEGIIENNDTDLLDVLEADDAIYKVEKEEYDEIESDMALGRYAKMVCDECLDVIRGRNGKMVLSKQDIKNMKIAFADLFVALTDGSPKEVRIEVDRVTDEPVLNLKHKLQKVLSKRGF